jgi:hypothetical protein
MRPIYSDELGMRQVNISILSMNGFDSICPSKLWEIEAETWCTLIEESNPAVMRSEEVGSYKQRHIPLPLYIKKPRIHQLGSELLQGQ